MAPGVAGDARFSALRQRAVEVIRDLARLWGGDDQFSEPADRFY